MPIKAQGWFDAMFAGSGFPGLIEKLFDMKFVLLLHLHDFLRYAERRKGQTVQSNRLLIPIPA